MPFDDLPPSDVAVLVQMFNRVRGEYFNDYFNGLTSFTLAHWTKDLDGYHRACRFWGQNQEPTLLVYVPV